MSKTPNGIEHASSFVKAADGFFHNVNKLLATLGVTVIAIGGIIVSVKNCGHEKPVPAKPGNSAGAGPKVVPSNVSNTSPADKGPRTERQQRGEIYLKVVDLANQFRVSADLSPPKAKEAANKLHGYCTQVMDLHGPPDVQARIGNIAALAISFASKNQKPPQSDFDTAIFALNDTLSRDEDYKAASQH
jgi:hypothetical protein